MTKIFVTGATGLIGTKLVKRLKEGDMKSQVLLHQNMVNRNWKMQVCNLMSVIFLKPTQLMQL